MDGITKKTTDLIVSWVNVNNWKDPIRVFTFGPLTVTGEFRRSHIHLTLKATSPKSDRALERVITTRKKDRDTLPERVADALQWFREDAPFLREDIF